MNSYAFFELVVSRLEEMQKNLDALRDAVKQKIRECVQETPAQ